MTSEDATILMRTTGSHLLQAMSLIELWGLRFINVLLVWRKVKTNGTTNGKTLGLWSRSNCEFMLLAAKGNIFKYRNRRIAVNQYL